MQDKGSLKSNGKEAATGNSQTPLKASITGRGPGVSTKKLQPSLLASATNGSGLELSTKMLQASPVTANANGRGPGLSPHKLQVSPIAKGKGSKTGSKGTKEKKKQVREAVADASDTTLLMEGVERGVDLEGEGEGAKDCE